MGCIETWSGVWWWWCGEELSPGSMAPAWSDTTSTPPQSHMSQVWQLSISPMVYLSNCSSSASSGLHRQRYQLFNKCDNLDQVGEVDMSFTSVLLQVCVTKSFCAPPTYLWRDSATKTENWNCTLNSIWKAYSVLKYRGLRLTMCCTKRLSTICQQLKHLLLL